jgi:hypothetical protein
MLVELYLAFLSQPVSFAPLIKFRGADYLEDSVQLIEFVGARKERSLDVQLSHDAPDSEYVAEEVVVVRSQHALGCSIPSRTDVAGVRASLRRQVLASAEVDYPGVQRVLVDHYVFRFQVSVHDAELVVKKLYADQHLPHDGLDFFFVKFYHTFLAFLFNPVTHV